MQSVIRQRIPSLSSAPHMMAVQQPVVAQSTTYPQQQQQFVSRQQPDSAGYRTEVRYSPTTGRQIQIKVPVNNSPAHTGPEQYRNELRYNTHTGVPYHVHVPLQGCSPNQQPQYGQPLHQQPALQGRLPQQSQPQEQYLPNQDVSHHVQQSFSHLYDQQQDHVTLSRQDRVAGIVSLLEGGVTKKQPKIIEHAKKCPTKWSKQATMNSINLPLYAWGAVTEVESSLSGRTEAMLEGVLLGKLRHLKNVLEVCCLNSSATDFTAYVWTLARDYAVKVENEVEQKLVTWQDMPVGVRTATLVSAQMEHPRVTPKFDPKKTLNTGRERDRDTRDTRDTKDNCTTFNKCTTEGKCDYEVQFPDKTCQRKHECSWCRTNRRQSCRHQAWRCKSKGPAANGSG